MRSILKPLQTLGTLNNTSLDLLLVVAMKLAARLLYTLLINLNLRILRRVTRFKQGQRTTRKRKKKEL